MRGSIRKRGKNYQGRVDIGPDPKTGKRHIIYITRAKKGEIEAEITDILSKLRGGEFVDSQKTLVGEWLDRWFEAAINGSKRPRTCDRYRGIIDQHLKPALGHIVLQRLQALDIEQ